MLSQLIRQLRRWLAQIWRKFTNWINPTLPEGYNPPRLPDHEYEWLFRQLLKGVDRGWTTDQVTDWLRRNERRVTESRWLEWLPRFEDTAKQDREIKRQLLLLARLGCGEISQAAAQLAADGITDNSDHNRHSRVRRKPMPKAIDGNPSATDNSDHNRHSREGGNPSATDNSDHNRHSREGGNPSATDNLSATQTDNPSAANLEAKKWFEDGKQKYLSGDFLGAVASFDRALEIKPDIFEAWFFRGLALLDVGEYQQAIESYDQALEIKPDYHEAWSNRGAILCDRLGEYERAVASFDRALEFKPDLHEAWANRGLAAGKLISAAPFMVPVSNGARLSQLLQNPALDLRDYPGQIASYQAGLNQCPKETHPQGWGILHYEIGKARYFRGKLATRSAGTTTDESGQRQTARYFYGQARNSYQEALTVITAESGAGASTGALPLQGLHLKIVEDLIKALLELGENREAREYHQQGFSILRGLINQAYQSDTPVGAMPPCLPRSADPPQPDGVGKGGLRVKRLQLKFALYYRFAFDFAAQDATQNNDWSMALAAAELDKNIPLTWLLSATTDPGEISPSFAQMRTLVNETTALVYWYYSSRSFITFILTRDNLTPISFSADSLLAVESFITDWNRDYQKYGEKKSDRPVSDKFTRPTPPKFRHRQGGPRPTPPKLGGQGGQIQTWQEKLPGYLDRLKTLLNIPEITAAIPSEISQLILIPHRDLHRLPLEALFPGDLIMSRLPSAAFGLRNFQKSHSIPGANLPANLLMVAYPNNPKLKSLQYSETEATVIKLIWEKSSQEIQNLVYTAATSDRLDSAFRQSTNEGKNNQIFHFSGHGTYNQEKPNLSCLFLTGDDKLTAAEIANLALSYYGLAYINACETGITNIETIDTEYVGLVSAFLRAGVGQVISSLWPVNDQSAGLLAIKFYQEYVAGELAVIALKKAKTWLQSATWADITQVYQKCLEDASESDASLLEKAKSRSEKNNPQDIPFESAYFWAGLVISG